LAEVIDFQKVKKEVEEIELELVNNFKEDVIDVLNMMIEEVKEGKIKGLAFALTRSHDTEDLQISSSWLGLAETKSSMYSSIKFLNHRFEHDYFNSLIPQDFDDE